MKKFKLNKNISKKILTLSLTSIITLTYLIGCSNSTKSNLIAFKGENLDNVKVITFEDNERIVANKVSYCSTRVCNGKHDVYKSATSSEMFTDDECFAKSSADYLGTTLNKYSIKNIENILPYLTIEEIEKANKNNLNENDISNIISRIFNEEENIIKTKKAN